MQLIYIYFHGQCVEFNYEICCILLLLLEGFYYPFGICCLCLVTKYGLDFLDKIFPILGSSFFVQFIKLSLHVNTYYTSSEVSQNRCDSVIGLHDPVALEKQSYPSLPVFHLVTIKLPWVQYCYSTRVWTDFGLGLELGPQIIISLQRTQGQEGT